MQFRKPSMFAAGLGIVLFWLPARAAHQSPTPGASETTVNVPPPDVPKPSDSSPDAKDTKKDENNIRVQVNEVIVPVTVTDEKGRFVSDLEKKDFQVFEENKPQTIRYFTRERSQPVVIGFLLDLSTASRIHWKNFQDATIELIQNLLPGDPKYAGYLIDFSQDAEIAVNTTTDPEPMVEKIRKLKPGGGAALYDAIYLGCTTRKLIQGEPIEPRRVMIIIGDGHDNASKHSLNQVIELAQRNLITIYCISTSAFGFTNQSEDNLVRLATETGGRVVYPLGDVYKDTDGYLSHPSDDGNYALTVGTGAYRSAVDGRMYHAVADIAGEVTTQYILRYVSDNQTSKSYRNVKVVVDLGNVHVRARKGYYAVTP
ncbi:MAG: VWA domain-containing protein [Acidobacteriaceae bacterium]|nr:VWA domain-containing protein [Acidobacteriaceae bacterium]MBV9294387.1 VWA domain-containing protein [Acidobacteriaceae bacterium]MBV9766626.1 VWA domain-containing protein [Acidobacteriaceae bacterium]